MENSSGNADAATKAQMSKGDIQAMRAISNKVSKLKYPNAEFSAALSRLTISSKILHAHRIREEDRTEESSRRVLSRMCPSDAIVRFNALERTLIKIGRI
jgi:mannitol-specific phosphotransferase system IIBC component